MITEKFANFVEHVAAEVRKAAPEESAHLSDIQLQTAIIDGLRAYGSDMAEEALRIDQLTQAAKALRQLVALQQ